MTQSSFIVRPIQPVFEISDWRGRSIPAAQSRGGVIAVADFADNMLRSTRDPWPPAPVLQKLCGNSQHASAFDEQARELLVRKLGHYCDLQSLHSEDAITWSFFGTLSYAAPEVRASFLRWLLKRLTLPSDDQPCEIELWRRIPHPDTQGQGGPEIDFLIHGERTMIFGEAKWLSAEGTGQGVSRKKSQIQLRTEFCSSIARRIFSSSRFVVLGVVLDKPLAKDIDLDCDVSVRNITWTELASWNEHPQANEFSHYYEWKRHWSNM